MMRGLRRINWPVLLTWLVILLGSAACWLLVGYAIALLLTSN